MSNYPPGAADDPNAPYNQPDQDCEYCGEDADDCECEFCEDCGVEISNRLKGGE